MKTSLTCSLIIVNRFCYCNLRQHDKITGPIFALLVLIDTLLCSIFIFALTGTEEAIKAGKTLKQANYEFDVAHTSVLTRAQDTLCKILTELSLTDIPVHKTWRLNERHYGSLTGLNKSETAAKYGEEQVSTISGSCQLESVMYLYTQNKYLNIFSFSSTDYHNTSTRNSVIQIAHYDW